MGLKNVLSGAAVGVVVAAVVANMLVAAEIFSCMAVPFTL